MKLASSINSSLKILLRNGPKHCDLSNIKGPLLHSPFYFTLQGLKNGHSMELDEAEKNFKNALELLKQTFGTHDAYLDIGGTLNDLAAVCTVKGDHVSASKYLKRALMMTERSYRINNHLNTCLLSSLIDNAINRNSLEEASTFSDRLNVIIATNDIINISNSNDKTIIKKRVNANMNDFKIIKSIETNDEGTSSDSDIIEQDNETVDVSFIESIHPTLRLAESYLSLARAMLHTHKHQYRFEEALIHIEQCCKILSQMQNTHDVQYSCNRLLSRTLQMLHKLQLQSLKERGRFVECILIGIAADDRDQDNPDNPDNNTSKVNINEEGKRGKASTSHFLSALHASSSSSSSSLSKVIDKEPYMMEPDELLQLSSRLNSSSSSSSSSSLSSADSRFLGITGIPLLAMVV